jgi:fructose-1,6-bisphosphatase/inositol monophosphatase family enzyme
MLTDGNLLNHNLDMSKTATPRVILETLFPYLKVAAGYARLIQPKIQALPAKEGDNAFAAALSDADLSIQNFIEVTLLGLFPEIRFYGEEYEQSSNTKYFRSIELGEQGDYLVTLDPIDGTRFYLDGHSNYQIILSVLNRDYYEAVLAISPAIKQYYYAIRGFGSYYGSLETAFNQCQPLTLNPDSSSIFLGTKVGDLKPQLSSKYDVIDIAASYSDTDQIPTVNGILTGDLSGVVLQSGQFIDGAALGFIVEEAGGFVSNFAGESLPPLCSCKNYKYDGIVMAASASVQQDLLKVTNS